MIIQNRMFSVKNEFLVLATASLDFPCGSAGRESTRNAGNLGSIPGLGRSPGKGKDQIRSDQSLSRFRLFATPWIAARQASLSITNSWSSLKLTSIELVMPSSHLILCCPLLLLPPIPYSIRVFSNESTLHVRGPNTGVSASASFLPMNTQNWSPLEWTGWIFLQSKGLLRVFCNTTLQKHQFLSAQLSSQSNSHIHTWPQEKP